MVQFTLEERIFTVECYILTRSPNKVIRQFRERFPHRNTPTKVTVLSNYQKYHLFATSCNRNKGNSGRRRTIRTTENVQRVREILETARRNPTGLPKTCINEITRLDLRWHPCMIQVSHLLLPGGFQRRIDFCTCFLERLEAFLRFLAIGDEAAFQMKRLQLEMSDVMPRNTISQWNTPFPNRCQGETFGVDWLMRKWAALRAILFRRQRKR